MDVCRTLLILAVVASISYCQTTGMCGGEEYEYSDNEEYCYQVGDAARTWAGAMEYCKSRRGSIANSYSAYYVDLFEVHGLDTFWSGIFIQDSSLLEDTNTTPIAISGDLSLWNQTEPFKAPVDQCVLLRQCVPDQFELVNCGQYPYLLEFTACDEKHTFVCALPITKFSQIIDVAVTEGGLTTFSVEEPVDYNFYFSTTASSEAESDQACAALDPHGIAYRITTTGEEALLAFIQTMGILLEFDPALTESSLVWVEKPGASACYVFALSVESMGDSPILNWPCDDVLPVLCQTPKTYEDFETPQMIAAIQTTLIRQVNNDILAHSDVFRVVGGLAPLDYNEDFYIDGEGQDYPDYDGNSLADLSPQSLAVGCDLPFLSTRQASTVYKNAKFFTRNLGEPFYETRDLIYYADISLNGDTDILPIDVANSYSCDANDLATNQLVQSNTLFFRPTNMEIYSFHLHLDKSQLTLTWSLPLLQSLMGELTYIEISEEVPQRRRRQSETTRFEDFFLIITAAMRTSNYLLKPLILRDETDTTDMVLVSYAYKDIPERNASVFYDVPYTPTQLDSLQKDVESIDWASWTPGVLRAEVRSIDWCWATQRQDDVTNRIYDLPETRAPNVWESSEICARNSAPLVKVACMGNKREGFYWGPTEVNPLCDYSAGNDEPSEITQTLQTLSQENVTSDNVVETVEELEEILADTEPEVITPTDVNYIADIIQKVTTAAEEDGELDLETVEEVLRVIDQVSDLAEDVLEEAQDLGNSNNRLLEAADELGGLLSLPDGASSQRVVSGGLGLEVWDLSSQDQSSSFILGIKMLSDGSQEVVDFDELISQFAGEEITYDTTDAAIYLPAEFVQMYLAHSDNTSETRLVFNVYKATSLYRYPESSSNDDGETLNQTLNSRVVAAQLLVDGEQITDLGGYKVLAVFEPLTDAAPDEERPNVTSCVFWDYTANDGTGWWSEEGCEYSRSVDGRDVCECDHLTNFAVLVSYYDQSSLEHEEILGYITLIGLSLSIVCLALSMLSFICIKKLRQGLPHQVLFQLSLALILGWIVFLAGIERTSNRDACIAVAALLHYLILASFMWMLMEGLLQYLLFVRVMNTYFPNFLWKVSIVSWVIPAIVVGIVCAVDYEHYDGGEDYCWMDNDAFIFAFAIPVGIILATNLVVFIMVTVSLCRRKDMSKHSTQKTNQTLVNIRASFISFAMLGLTWIFGFLAIEDAALAFQYLFCILASLQGFIIFLMMTVRDKQVRQYWMNACRSCCSCLPKGDPSTSGSSSQSKTGSQDPLRIPRVHSSKVTSRTDSSALKTSRGSDAGSAMEIINPSQVDLSMPPDHYDVADSGQGNKNGLPTTVELDGTDSRLLTKL